MDNGHTIIRVRRYKVGYEVRTESIKWHDDDESLTMQSAYTFDGHYIGSPAESRFLINKRGIKPDIAHPEQHVCSVGFCEREQKWYGWSHRAIQGYGIGDKFFVEFEQLSEKPFDIKERYASKLIDTLDEARQAAINFADSVA